MMQAICLLLLATLQAFGQSVVEQTPSVIVLWGRLEKCSECTTSQTVLSYKGFKSLREALDWANDAEAKPAGFHVRAMFEVTPLKLRSKEVSREVPQPPKMEWRTFYWTGGPWDDGAKPKSPNP